MATPRLEVRDVLGERVVPMDRIPFTIGRRETRCLRLASTIRILPPPLVLRSAISSPNLFGL